MRLLTRSDFDGMACGALLFHLGVVNEWRFVQPRDIQDGSVEVTDNDILANIPYVRGCRLWFDHHSSESERLGRNATFEGVSRHAPSCAHVIYDYYGGDRRLARFYEMIRYVDKVDSGALLTHEITNPQGWVLLGFIMDPRTGLSRVGNFTVSDQDLLRELATACASRPIEEILDMSDVRERLDCYHEQDGPYRAMLAAHARRDGPVAIADLRGVNPVRPGSRFLIYPLFPEQNIAIWVVDEGDRQVITVGHSIINRTATVDVGRALLKYGGGGHARVGTCRVKPGDADRVLGEIVALCGGGGS